MDNLKIGKRLQLLRKKAGMTQKDLACRSGISYSYLTKLESGTNNNPSYSTLETITAAMGFSPCYLFGAALEDFYREEPAKRHREVETVPGMGELRRFELIPGSPFTVEQLGEVIERLKPNRTDLAVILLSLRVLPGLDLRAFGIGMHKGSATPENKKALAEVADVYSRYSDTETQNQAINLAPGMSVVLNGR